MSSLERYERDSRDPAKICVKRIESICRICIKPFITYIMQDGSRHSIHYHSTLEQIDEETT